MAKKYNPRSVSSNADLVAFLNEELRNIAESINSIIENLYEQIDQAPAKVKDGIIIYADGVNFNPGSGKGLYIRNNGTWQKL